MQKIEKLRLFWKKGQSRRISKRKLQWKTKIVLPILSLPSCCLWWTWFSSAHSSRHGWWQSKLFNFPLLYFMLISVIMWLIHWYTRSWIPPSEKTCGLYYVFSDKVDRIGSVCNRDCPGFYRLNLVVFDIKNKTKQKTSKTNITLCTGFI